MNIDTFKLLSDITFKTQSYRKNFDLINNNENIITEHEGTIIKIRLSERKYPFIVGEYGFSVWDVKLANLLNIDVKKLVIDHVNENTYDELFKQFKSINLKNTNKLILLHTFILHKNYRKHEITEEFIEMIYRDFYDDNNIIIALVKPFQDNLIDADYYFNHKKIQIKDSLKTNIYQDISAIDYYSLNEFVNETDTENNEYKLFNVAAKCGFSRINESYLFKFSPEKTISRIKQKRLIS